MDELVREVLQQLRQHQLNAGPEVACAVRFRAGALVTMLRISIIKRVMRMREALHRDPVTGDLHPDDQAFLESVPLSPILRTCPFCCAAPMRECVSMGGRKRKFHKQRRAVSLGRR